MNPVILWVFGDGRFTGLFLTSKRFSYSLGLSMMSSLAAYRSFNLQEKFFCINMYAQTLAFPKHIPLDSSTPKQQKELAFSSKSKCGFFNSAKKVSVLRSISRKCGQTAAIRSGVVQTEQGEKQEEHHDDGFYIRRCVELAKKAVGRTSPNPMVGCVIVRDGKIVGEGFHPKAGQPHAEVFALRDAGDLAENGTAYVSLEPCNHYGRTPPCTEALIKAKVRKVVVGVVDQNPLVASTGVKRLQDAGIEVVVGVEEETCRQLNEAFFHRMLTGLPFLTLRYSISLDGHFLNQLGEDVIECGGYYSKLLQEYDGIILCSSVLMEKSSVPVSNEPGANQPLKIVLSKSPNPIGEIPALSNDDASKLMIMSETNTSLVQILENCKQQGMCSVLLDLRGNTADFDDVIKDGFEQNLFQKVLVEVLPVYGGDQERVLNHTGLTLKVKKLTSRNEGNSILLEGYF